MVAPAESLAVPQGGGPVVQFQQQNVWRTGFTILAVVAIALFLDFVLEDGGATIFTVIISWFAAMAMAPAVNRLAKRMPRGVATLIVMLGFMLFAGAFLFTFGRLFIEQIAGIVRIVPDLVDSLIQWLNSSFNLDLDRNSILESIGLTTDRAQEIATQLAGQAIGILGSVLSTVFSLFTFGLFTFYLSADGPRLRRWLATLLPARSQSVFLNAWDITTEKTGNYVSARVILAAINSSLTAIVFLIIGMPYWLALALWTGIVAQFIPTIGTYISIILPVVVGLTSGNPTIGVLALVWGILYQQVENLTFEPRISARAVNVHPAVAFGSVMLGAALFGVSGAFLAVPVTAMLLALLEIYAKRHELAEESALKPDAPRPLDVDGDVDALA